MSLNPIIAFFFSLLFSLTKGMNFTLLFLFVSGESKVLGMDAWMKKWYKWSVAQKDIITFFRVWWQRSSGNHTSLLRVGLIRSGCSGTRSSKLWTLPKIGMPQLLMATCFGVWLPAWLFLSLTSNWNFSCSSLCLLPLILFWCTCDRSLGPSPLYSLIHQ